MEQNYNPIGIHIRDNAVIINRHFSINTLKSPILLQLILLIFAGVLAVIGGGTILLWTYFGQGPFLILLPSLVLVLGIYLILAASNILFERNGKGAIRFWNNYINKNIIPHPYYIGLTQKDLKYRMSFTFHEWTIIPHIPIRVDIDFNKFKEIGIMLMHPDDPAISTIYKTNENDNRLIYLFLREFFMQNVAEINHSIRPLFLDENKMALAKLMAQQEE